MYPCGPCPRDFESALRGGSHPASEYDDIGAYSSTFDVPNAFLQSRLQTNVAMSSDIDAAYLQVPSPPPPPDDDDSFLEDYLPAFPRGFLERSSRPSGRRLRGISAAERASRRIAAAERTWDPSKRHDPPPGNQSQ